MGWTGQADRCCPYDEASFERVHFRRQRFAEEEIICYFLVLDVDEMGRMTTHSDQMVDASIPEATTAKEATKASMADGVTENVDAEIYELHRGCRTARCTQTSKQFRSHGRQKEIQQKAVFTRFPLLKSDSQLPACLLFVFYIGMSLRLILVLASA